ncbi:Anaerobic dimethyl sulfoxide reductase chain B, iron-sulfur binding subunit [hydrothermal vent metagenome]|uniref:Anaerobic dimethyl sulfoxide reductase chain B, iron-sulfur binding subunit n=1 Tax=hydrothermal vent metagenome TaxID=652676 RepID=A0A3B1B1N6_9ZZZZ
MYKVRNNEPSYAFVPQADAPQTNRYGKKIELVDKSDPLAGKSLNINGDTSVSDNPNRYKQHGFYFNADNCIACHACESACSEKNDLPPHIAYRAVGYVEGGSYPNYTRLNISMACNHCDDPVCLKGCPTRAYTKFAEYGAVLQDPDICFGCGYCTWVCPYNAPQLDTTRGHVMKCNMCVDRLEVGLKPACAAACLGGALDFGVIETTPENREQLKTQIPGFPTTDITHPNIRFQQTRSLPREMTRTDAMPLRYERDQPGASDYRSKLHDRGEKSEWNLAKLRSREDPLVIFTLITQSVIGVFLALFLAPYLGLTELSLANNPALQPVVLFSLLGLETFALALSTMHLGRPHRFYRAFNNLRYSPVSREVAGVAVFFNFLGAYTVLSSFPTLFAWLPQNLLIGLQQFCGWGATISGPLALYFMHRIYRIKARPFWNHWQVLTSFYGNMLSIGSVLIIVIFAAALLFRNESFSHLIEIMRWPLLLGLLLEATGLYFHTRDNRRAGGEAAASHFQQRTQFGKTWLLRNILLATAGALVLALSVTAIDGILAYSLWLFSGSMIIVSALISRALFYVLVIPTTMPGAFFWRNRGFQEHARETGLAEMPQTGVVVETH